MRCPKCLGTNSQVFRNVTRQGYGATKGCLGYLLGGPLGLLCGFCGKNQVKSEEIFWICNDCGCRFNEAQSIAAESYYKSKCTLEKSSMLLKDNPDVRKIVNRKIKSREILNEGLSEKELKRFIFFENDSISAEAIAIFHSYRKYDCDMRKECIYFMYNENTISSACGIIAASNGIYYLQGFKHKFMPANQIKKVFMNEEKIHIGSTDHKVSFDYLDNSASRKLVADVLRFLYVEKKEQTEATTAITGYGNHINGGIVAELDGKLYYASADRRALVVRNNDDEKVLWDFVPTFLAEYNGELYLTGEKNRIGKIDINTAEITYLCNVSCDSVHLYNGMVAFSNDDDKGRLYLMTCNGEYLRKIVDDKVSDITLSDEWIYYINRSDKSSIYKVRYNGSDKTKIFGGEMKCSNLILANRHLYFLASNFNNFNELYKISVENGTMERVMTNVSCYTVTDTYIFAMQKDNLMCSSIDDMSKMYYFIKDKKASHLCVVNGYLYFDRECGFVNRYVTHRVDCEGGTVEEL